MRRRLVRFLGLSRAEQVLVVRAWVLVGLVHYGLRWLSLKTVRRLLGCGRRRGAPRCTLPPERIAWAVEVAARCLPGQASCLTKAVAAERLFAHNGQPVQLCLGIGRGPDRSLLAHAWLEHDRQVLLGQTEDRLTRLPALDRGGSNREAGE